MINPRRFEYTNKVFDSDIWLRKHVGKVKIEKSRMIDRVMP
jgi:hypothetical protein